MDIFKLIDMKKGWFIGDFEPTTFKTDNFEVSYRIHPKGEKWDTHFHKIGTEINLLIRGKMKICDKILNSGDIFIIHPFEISSPEFYEDCEIVCIKTPSLTNDKFIVE